MLIPLYLHGPTQDLLGGCNRIQTHNNHLVLKQTLNYLAKLAYLFIRGIVLEIATFTEH